MKLSFSVRPVSLACVAACACLSPLASLAQSAASGSANAPSGNQLPPMFVTAQRAEQSIERVVADVSVIEREAIQQSGAVGLADVLARLPGVELARTGGFGATTSVFVRGAESRFTAVYIDGVRVDSQATGGAPWEAIPLALVDRIEVLRGPASAVYGSDALAGVVQIFTRRATTAFAPQITLGLGTQRSGKLAASASGQSGVLDYTVGLAAERSRGFNSRPVPTQNPDLDGYRSESGHARLGVQVNRNHRLEGSLLASQTDAQYDGGFPVSADDHSQQKLQTASAQWRAQWSDTYRTRLVLTDSRARYEMRPNTYLATTNLQGAALHNEFNWGASQGLLTLERKVDALQNAPLDKRRHQDGLGLGYNLKTGAHTLQLNLRRDQDSEFGGKGTGSAAYAYTIVPGLRASASVGTGFRVPTLYQRFSDYGVASLKPESSQNAELALRYARGGTELGAVVYRSRVTDLITFSAPGPCVSAFGCYANTARAKLEGITLSARHAIGPVDLRASFDVQDPRDLDTGKQLARRARQHGNLGVDWRVAARSVIGAEVQASGARFSSPGETLPLPGYAVLNLRASTTVARDWNLFARLDNVANHPYQLVSGYATAGRTAWVGATWAPR